MLTFILFICPCYFVVLHFHALVNTFVAVADMLLLFLFFEIIDSIICLRRFS